MSKRFTHTIFVVVALLLLIPVVGYANPASPASECTDPTNGFIKIENDNADASGMFRIENVEQNGLEVETSENRPNETITISNPLFKDGGELVGFSWTSSINMTEVVVVTGDGPFPYPGGTSGIVPEQAKGISHITFCFVPTTLNVTVSDTRAISPSPGFVDFVWNMFLDGNTVGFNVLAEQPDGTLAQVNETLISVGDLMQLVEHTFTYSASGIEATHFYIQLERIEGDPQQFGPFTFHNRWMPTMFE